MEEELREIKEEKDILFIFLKRVKKGEYAPIEESSLEYSRIDTMRESREYSDEEYLYSVS